MHRKFPKPLLALSFAIAAWRAALAQPVPDANDAAPDSLPVSEEKKPLVPDAQIEEVLAIVERDYVRPVHPDTLALLARERSLDILDPYSVYLDPVELEYTDRDLAGSFGGIGVRLDETPASDGFRIEGAIIGSPALRAGIRAGDILVAIDGKATRGWTLGDMLSAAIGEPGTSVLVAVKSGMTGSARIVTIPREIIAVTTVRGVRCNANGTWDYRLPMGRAAYLRITGFAETTVADFDAALDAIERDDAGKLILDLRGNAGGLSQAAVEVADRLIDVGLLVTYLERNAAEPMQATPGVRLDWPIAMLVDGATISAGEILASALQDNGRVITVGARTYGKGTVQKIFRLAEGGAAKLAIAHYERPSGAPIERHASWGDPERGGVWPDSGMVITASDEQWAEWSEELSEHDERAVLALDAISGWPVKNDLVLERAIEALHATR